MASEGPILAFDEAIDDQIVAFCEPNATLDVEAVLRDIARIACIANLVRNGTLDGDNMVLCGGMAMRCLDSPRMSVYDGDTAALAAPDVDTMRDAISYSEPDIAISVESWYPSKELITFQPISYEARFSDLPGSDSEFSLSIAHRGIELPAEWARFNHRYPFPVLADEIDVPIMHPDEILAEKVVAWWLFGHAKHYNDIAFLSLRMRYGGKADLDPDRRQQVRRTIEKKLAANESVSSSIAQRVQALASVPERRRRLEDPDDHIDPNRDFDTLSYLHGQAPERQAIKKAIDNVLLPLLFD